MKKVIVPFFFVVASSLYAVDYLSPESVEYHLRSNRYFISNGNECQFQNSQLVCTDANILVRTATDPTLKVYASSNPDRSYGLEILNGVLFAANNHSVKGYSIDNIQGIHAPIMELAIPGAAFLNGITSNGKNILYVSDMGTNKIYKIDVSTLSTPIYSELTGTNSTPPDSPNGLLFDKLNNRLLIGTYEQNAKIVQYDFSTQNYSTVVTVNFFGVDGITMDCQNRIYVTDGSHLIRFDLPLGSSQPVVVADSLPGAADITYNRRTAEIVIPNMQGNTLTTYPVQGCEASLFLDDFEP